MILMYLSNYLNTKHRKLCIVYFIFNGNNFHMNSLEKAKKLYNSCKSLSSYEDDFQIQINDSEEAYQIQEDFIKIKKLDLADSIGGWKVALTNPVMQKLVGVDTPAEGAIMKSLIYSNNDYLNFNNYLHLGSEAEIAIRVVKTFPKDVKNFNNMDEIIPFLGEVYAALEIVDDRHSADKSNFEYLVAQNSMNHGCVLGEPETIDLLTLDQLEGDLIVSGEVFGSGKGKNVLQHPLNSILYLINSLIRRGRTLHEGEVILTGSIATTCWPKRGDSVEANIKGLSPVKFYVR